MTTILPGDDLLKRLDIQSREALARELCQAIDDMEAIYKPYFDDMTIWWRNYEGVPRTPGQKNFPFKNSSNIIVPLIQIMSDAQTNRIYGDIHGHGKRIWSARTENEGQVKQVKNVARHINWAANGNHFDMPLVSYEWINEADVIGSSVVALNWHEDIRWVYQTGGRGKLNKAVPIVFRKGVLVENIPREHILWDTAFLIQDAPMVVREFDHTWSKLNEMALSDREKTWDSKAIEDIRGKGEIRFRPSYQVTQEKAEHDSKNSGNFMDMGMHHDIREVHVNWPLLNSMGFDDSQIATPGKENMRVPSPPIVATLDKTSCKLLRLIAEPYNIPYKPFFDIYYRKRTGRGHSVGIAKKIEGMQMAMTTSLNQALDARTRSNAIWATTNRRDFLDKPIDPAHPIYRPTEGSFEPFNIGTSTFDDMRLMTAVQVIAERLTGQSDPALGRETRQGGHPSPATSTLALLEQSNLMSGTTKELIRLQYSRLGEAVAALYQQYDTNSDGYLQRTFGDLDAQDIEDYLFPKDPISGNIEFDLIAYSQNFNPESEMKKAVLISQMNTTYWAFMGQVVQTMAQLSNPQVPIDPQIRQIGMDMAARSIRAQTKSHEKFLEAGDVDDIEQFVAQLGAQNQNPDNVRGAIGGLGEVASANGGVPQPGVAGGNGLASNGAAGPPQGFGGRLQ